jgi:Uma2 family endonuclease
MTMPPASAVKRRMTADELLTMPDDGMRHELVDGALLAFPPPGARHGYVQLAVASLLRPHVKAHGLGEVFVGIGFVLKRDPDVVRAPDVSFLRADRMPETGLPDGYIEGPPDLAVEVISPSNTLYEVGDKIAQFLAAGTRLAWVINPRRRTVAVHAPGGPVHVLGDADLLDAADVVPGFRRTVRELMGDVTG